ncbi:ABC transporter ATP-binding protein [Mycetocola sp. 2940]|uniref:ABC transporter ATP-binding protein n=1 Tax=Mycetocola sp. 2940 TaxID=3156452 RepID=UPI0033911FB5
MSQTVSVRNLSLALGGKKILHELDLEVPAGSLVTLLGPSGSGKSTTLNVIAGFLSPDSGEVAFGGRDVKALPPGARNLGIVFQNYAIFPHMTVGANVGFPLKAQHWRGDHKRRVRDMLELVQLGGFEARRASSLSGGQQQRVALARALAAEPQLLLLDEPLSALDKQLREAMQAEIKQIQRRVGVTTISVTHDQSEALSMSDLVVVMNEGRIDQCGTPEEMYCRPRSEFLARFLGEVNLLPIDATGHIEPFGTGVSAGGGQLAAVRPESFSVLPWTPVRSSGIAQGRIVAVLFQGGTCRLEVAVPALEENLIVRTAYSGLGSVPTVGDDIAVGLTGHDVHVVALSKVADSAPALQLT